MPTIKRKKRHVRPKAKIDLIGVTMCGGDQAWTPEELTAIKHEAERIGADEWFAGFLAEHERWKLRAPEPILSDADGAAILSDPAAHVQHVPGGFKVWLLRQPDGDRLWRGWLEEIRLSQVERKRQNA